MASRDCLGRGCGASLQIASRRRGGVCDLGLTARASRPGGRRVWSRRRRERRPHHEPPGETNASAWRGIPYRRPYGYVHEITRALPGTDHTVTCFLYSTVSVRSVNGSLRSATRVRARAAVFHRRPGSGVPAQPGGDPGRRAHARAVLDPDLAGVDGRRPRRPAAQPGLRVYQHHVDYPNLLTYYFKSLGRPRALRAATAQTRIGVLFILRSC